MPEALESHAAVGGLLTAAAYLLGSVSFGLLAARRQGVDLRTAGSGNVGATNVERVLGKRTGRAVMILDALKGFIPAAVAHAVLGAPHPWTSLVGFAAALGHVFPIWHGLRGGKAAATALGALLATTPLTGALGIGVFFAVKGLSRWASLGTLIALPTTVAVEWLRAGFTETLLLALALTGLVYLRHVGNLKRLLQGRELRP